MRSRWIMAMMAAAAAAALAQDAPSQPPAIPAGTAVEQIAAAARLLDEAIQGPGPVSADVAGQVVATLRTAVPGRADLADDLMAQYSQTLARAHLLAGDAQAAGRVASLWARAGGARAYRLLIVAQMAAGQAREAGQSLDAVNRQDAKWKPWVSYVRPLLRLVGKTPEAVALPLEGGGVFRPSEMGDGVAVLYFWAVGPGLAAGQADAGEQDMLLQNALMEKFAAARVTIIGVNLDEGPSAQAAKALAARLKVQTAQYYRADHGEACPVPAPVALSAVPTAVVMGKDGQVVYVGDSRTVDLPVAVGYALALAERRRESPRRGGQREEEGEMGGRMGLSQMLETPSTEPAQQEAQARKLYDDGLNQVILGQRTRNPQPRQQGLELLRRCAEQYGDTQWGRMANERLIEYGD